MLVTIATRLHRLGEKLDAVLEELCTRVPVDGSCAWGCGAREGLTPVGAYEYCETCLYYLAHQPRVAEPIALGELRQVAYTRS